MRKREGVAAYERVHNNNHDFTSEETPVKESLRETSA